MLVAAAPQVPGHHASVRLQLACLTVLLVGILDVWAATLDTAQGK